MSTIEKKRDFLFKIIVQHGSRSGFGAFVLGGGADAHGAPRSSTMVVVGGATDTEHAMPCHALLWGPAAGDLVRLTVVTPTRSAE
jgi:hypothetical protein